LPSKSYLGTGGRPRLGLRFQRSVQVTTNRHSMDASRRAAR
jgi:hypothetical protein